jgi:transposase
MLYAGVDYHKRYSQVHVIDQSGRTRAAARLANDDLTVSKFFAALREPCTAVLEAGWNWGVMYDRLEAIDNVSKVELAHPYRVRAIAAAQVKTDSIDAHTLAQLVRSSLIPRAYVPGSATRQLREIVRQRVFLVRVRTMVKNRIHALLDRYHVPLPAVSDIFGKRGRDYLTKVELPAAAQKLLRQDMVLVETLSREISTTEQWLREAVRDDHRVTLLRTVPGLGDLLATVVALEIDRIDRFPTAAKLAAYAGLVPTTYSSGGHTAHGQLMVQSNKWLRWALVEAAWIAVRLDPYFRTHFARRRAHKPAQTAIVASARRLLEVIWHMLNEDRCYQNRSPLGVNRQPGGASAAALTTT